MSIAEDAPATVGARDYEASYRVPADLAVVREVVRTGSVALGLPAMRAELLTLAVTELATNTLQHTTGGGRIRMWASGGRLLCEVTDQGPMRSLGRPMPAPDAIRGRGLAIVERLCDRVEIDAEPDGVRVRLTLDL